MAERAAWEWFKRSSPLADLGSMLRFLDHASFRTRDIALLHQVSTGLARSETFEQAASVLAREAVSSVHRANECTISVWRPEDNAVLTAACFYDDGSQTDGTEGEYTGEIYSLAHRPESRTLLSEASGYSELRITDRDLPPQLRAEMEEWSWKSAVQLPLVSQGTAIGLIDVADYSSARRWARRDVAVLEMVATLAAMAMRVSVLEQIRHRVDHDSLTDLLNHRAFFERLAAELARAHRRGETIAVLILDLGNFKHVNDHAGHLAGDQVLRETAEAILTCCRTYDVGGRIGGDEFAMILTGVSQAASETAARRVLRAITARGNTTASIGVTTSLPGELDPLLVMARADEALLRAKRAGKQTVRLAA